MASGTVRPTLFMFFCHIYANIVLIVEFILKSCFLSLYTTWIKNMDIPKTPATKSYDNQKPTIHLFGQKQKTIGKCQYHSSF